jgi:hypothetical protein
MAEMRRCGAHQVILPDGSILQQAVVEILEGTEDAFLIAFHPDFAA